LLFAQLTQIRIFGFQTLFCYDYRISLVGNFGPINSRHTIYTAFNVWTDTVHDIDDNDYDNSCQIASNVTKQIETPRNGATKTGDDSNNDDTTKDDNTAATTTTAAETC
jgi:hypothetical protein